MTAIKIKADRSSARRYLFTGFAARFLDFLTYDGNDMKHLFSLVHLTNIACPPPALVRTAYRAGYDAVSIRTIPLGLPGEKPYDMAHDRQLRRETEQALQETGILYRDTEIARIADGVDVRDHEVYLEMAAEMGVQHVTTNIWSSDRDFYTDQFARLCDLAAQYGLTVNVEFVTWAAVADLAQTAALLHDVNRANAGVLVDCLHSYRSRVTPEEIRACPPQWFRYAHLCDCEKPIPTAVDELVHTGRAERLYPGEGSVSVAEIAAAIPNPDIMLGLEVPHERRLREYGFEEHARRALEAAKAVLHED